MKRFLSIILALAIPISTVWAGHGKHGGRSGYHGRHGGHFSSMSPQGGHKFSRSGPKFSRGKWGTYRNWSGRKWSGGGRGWYPLFGLGHSLRALLRLFFLWGLPLLQVRIWLSLLLGLVPILALGLSLLVLSFVLVRL